jgi:hypothetical protein
MASLDSPAASTFTIPIGKWGRIVITMFALGFLIVNVCIAYFIMHHAYPMLVYPAFVAFLAVHFLLRRKLPPRPAIISFIVAMECLVVLAVICMATSNHFFLVDFWRLTEPLYFLPVIGAYLAVEKVSTPRKEVAGAYLGIGGLFVALTFISMIPGNPVVSVLENPAGGAFSLIDGMLPAAMARDLFLFYHVPVILGSFGSAALLYGVVVFYTGTKITDLGFVALIIATVFSLYAFGVAIVWQILREQSSASGKKTNS